MNQALADGLRVLGQLSYFNSRAILARLEHQLPRALRPNGDGCRSRADAPGLPLLRGSRGAGASDTYHHAVLPDGLFVGG